TSAIKTYKHHKLKVFGLGKNHDNKFWNGVLRQALVLGFLTKGKETSTSITKATVTKVVKKKEVKQTIDRKAEDMLIDIDAKVLLSLIDDYNRGNQLWIVKTHLIVEKKVETIEEEEKITGDSNAKKRKRVYLPRLYTARDTFENVNATIHYGDDKRATVLKKETIKIDTECKDQDNYIIALLDRVHLRSGASYRYRIKRTVFKNYIIPYKSMANPNWFITCDGYYIHKNEVKVISKEVALERLKK
ncbi:MAG: RQC domain-containing protein, partial [Campylobacterota bacterium]|nr:RQC domain-containing protein [Campylobacterota bacterium]